MNATLFAEEAVYEKQNPTNASVIQWTGLKRYCGFRCGMLSTEAHVAQCGCTDVGAQLDLVRQI